MSDSIREKILAAWYKEFPKTLNSHYMPEDLLNDLANLIKDEQKAYLKQVLPEKLPPETNLGCSKCGGWPWYNEAINDTIRNMEAS